MYKLSKMGRNGKGLWPKRCLRYLTNVGSRYGFSCSIAVSKALQQHAEHTIFGYSYMSEEAIQSIVDWQNTRHDWHIEKKPSYSVMVLWCIS